MYKKIVSKDMNKFKEKPQITGFHWLIMTSNLIVFSSFYIFRALHYRIARECRKLPTCFSKVSGAPWKVSLQPLKVTICARCTKLQYNSFRNLIGFAKITNMFTQIEISTFPKVSMVQILWLSNKRAFSLNNFEKIPPYLQFFI